MTPQRPERDGDQDQQRPGVRVGGLAGEKGAEVLPAAQVRRRRRPRRPGPGGEPGEQDARRDRAKATVNATTAAPAVSGAVCPAP